MHTYSQEQRMAQLQCLRKNLANLIPKAKQLNLRQAQDYEEALAKVIEYLKNGFTQHELSELSRQVPDVFDRHRDWEAQILEQDNQGRWVEPQWFVELEKVLQPVLEAAGVLRITGHY